MKYLENKSDSPKIITPIQLTSDSDNLHATFYTLVGP